jgi:hypothetical protein
MATGKRGDEGRVCLCDRPDGTCAGLAVRRLSLERVRELAEEIWTASSEGLLPARSVADPRSSRAGASAQGAFVRRREQERQRWRLGWAWWTCAVVGAAGAGALVIGPTVGAWLAWPMALLLAGWTGWRLRFCPSAAASVWRRQAAMQRRTAAVLAPLTDDRYLVLHDVVLPGWLDSLDHLVVGPSGVWVLASWQPRRPLPGAVAPPAGTLRTLRRQTQAVAEALDGWASVPVRSLLCVQGRWSGTFRSFQGVRVVPRRQLVDALRAGSTIAAGEVGPATARLLDVLRPAA